MSQSPNKSGARKASLFLGKDHERWAHLQPERMITSAWVGGIRSDPPDDPAEWNEASSVHPMRANSLGIIAHDPAAGSHAVNPSAMEGAVPMHWPAGSEPARIIQRRMSATGAARARAASPPRTVLTATPERIQSPGSADTSESHSPGRRHSPPTSVLPSIEATFNQAAEKLSLSDTLPESKSAEAKSAWQMGEHKVLGIPASANKLAEHVAPTIQERRMRRSTLLSAARRGSRGAQEQLQRQTEAVPSAHLRAEIPLYGNATILRLAPRRAVEPVEGTLYDVEGPFMEGATSDSLSVRLFSTLAPDGQEPVSYLITTPDNRVSSAAKRRRWAMDNRGNFYAAMEIKSVESKLESAYPDGHSAYTLEMKEDLKKHFCDDILDELQKAETLSPVPMRVTPHVLQTEDGKLVRLEEDYPEEAFFVIAGCAEEELNAVVTHVFVEAIQALWRIHSHGWMHGDIKLENLMFNEQGKLMLIDFENACPFRGSAEHDGKIQLLSYDWTPPELEVSHLGRRMGPSGDLWALGCNLIRAYALRDGVEDSVVREMLLGYGVHSFFAFRKQLLSRTCHHVTNKSGGAGDVRFGIDLAPVFAHAHDTAAHPLVHPARLLRYFAKSSPCILQYLLACAVTPTVAERDEESGVKLAQEIRADPALAELWAKADDALRVSIGLSGSTWVRPKLNEAREILEIS